MKQAVTMNKGASQQLEVTLGPVERLHEQALSRVELKDGFD